MKRPLLIVLSLALFACDSSPPPKTASGMRLESVTIQEQFPLNPEGKIKEYTGDDLRKLVPLMDKQGLFDLTGQTFASKEVVESGTLLIRVKPVDQPVRVITAKSCAHEKICAFFTEAHAQGLVERKPVVCGSSAVACSK